MEKEKKNINAAKLLVQCLEHEGVRFVFGVPGEQNADFLMALEGSKIKTILVRHEQGGAFMANVIGRLTGSPGVCFSTLGPGATNLVTGVADANMDNCPVIAITGQASLSRRHKESHQYMDVVKMFSAITKWNTSILVPSAIPEVISKAFRVATSEKPGACHLEFPEDVAAQSISGDVQPLAFQTKVRRPVCDDKIIDSLWERIRSSEKPCILAGNGVIRHHATKQLIKFCDATNIPVLNTFMAKGAVPASKPYCLFTIGLSSGDPANEILESADLVICIGFDMVEFAPKHWNKGNLPIIHIDFQPAEVDENYLPFLEAVGDLSHTLWMLNERVQRDKGLKWDNYYKKCRDGLLKEFASLKDDKSKGLIKPQKAIADIQQLMKPTDILVSDVGAHKLWISRYYQCEEPNTCLITNGFCAMGFGLPGAMAAKLLNPDRKVLAVIGDGGFMMSIPEMETAKRLKLSIVVMVWADSAFGMIKWEQKNKYNGKHTDLSFTNPDFVKLAESIGWRGYYVDDSSCLKSTLEKALSDNECPSLIALPIDYSENDKLSKRLGELRPFL